MKVKTSITLPRELVKAIDARLERGHSRSEFIEAAVKAFLSKSKRNGRGATNARDRAILDRHAARLNREAADALTYQSHHKRFDPAKHAVWQARGAGKRPVRWVDEFLARDRSAR